MKRIVVLVAAVVWGCQSSAPPENPVPGKQRRVSQTPSADTGGRFFARGASGDTQELRLHKLAVDVTSRPGTVRSHLSMEVATPADGQSEAIIRLPVPRGAAVTDAVLWVNDRPMRGAFVERQRAQGIYTSIVTRRRDPALVTWDGPGWIAASIYPLEKNRPRRFELEWVEPAAVVDGRVQVRVPIVAEGERLVGRALVKVDGRRVSGNTGDLIAIGPADPHRVFTRRAPGDPFQQVMVREPAATGAPHFVLVAETSAAMTIANRERQHAILDGLFDGLPEDARLTLLSADWDVSPIVEDAGAAGWPQALAKLDAVPSAGALHLERVLREAAARASKAGAGAVLFVGLGEDGFRGDAASAPLAALRAARTRLSFVAVGDGAVPSTLAWVAAETGGEAIARPAFDDALPGLVAALRPRAGGPALDARGEGEWHLLRTVTGDAVWLGRALEPPTPEDGETARVDAGSPLALDLASLWDRARLEWHDRDTTDEIARVLTPVTSLLVLETEQDYRRFGLDIPQPIVMEQAGRVTRHKGEEAKMARQATVSRDGHLALREPRDNPDPLPAEQQPRSAGPLSALEPSSAPAPAPARAGSDRLASEEVRSIFGRGSALGADAQSVLGGLIGNQVGEAYGVGGLGSVGTGVGGGGTGERTLGFGTLGTAAKSGGSRRAVGPDVIPGQANVRGSVDKEIVRRVIRRHLNEVKYCYQQGLAQPNLGGRIVVQFTIAGSGQVLASVMQSSTMSNAYVESCIVQAVKRWEFPKPEGGGLAIVSYPFVLTPGDARGAPVAGPTAPAPRPIDEALATLAQGADAARIERIASLLGLRRVSSAEALAWTVPRRGADFETHLLVARLLEHSKRHHDAVRVLTEVGAGALPAVAAELKAAGADADADELLRLAKR
jgi:hypothetical protein